MITPMPEVFTVSSDDDPEWDGRRVEVMCTWSVGLFASVRQVDEREIVDCLLVNPWIAATTRGMVDAQKRANVYTRSKHVVVGKLTDKERVKQE